MEDRSRNAQEYEQGLGGGNISKRKRGYDLIYERKEKKKWFNFLRNVSEIETNLCVFAKTIIKRGLKMSIRRK